MQTLKVIWWNLVFLSLFGALCFGGLEFYLRTYQTFSTETVSAVGVPIFEPDSLNTYRHKPGATARNGYGVPTPKITINNLGFRETNDFEPNTTDKHLLMIGDSFTFGTGVGQDQTFSEILEDQLNPTLGPLNFSPKVERGLLADSLTFSSEATSFKLDPAALDRPAWQVWNAGHIGYSIGNYYVLLKKYAELIPLDTVVVNIFVANDITELRRKDWLKADDNTIAAVKDQKVFANAENKLESRTSTVPKSLAWWWLGQRLQVLRYKLELDDPEFAEPTLTWPVFLAEAHPAWDPKLPRYWERFFQGLQQLQDLAQQKDINLHVVLIPMDVQVDDSYRKKYARLYFDEDAKQADRPQTEVMNFCAARQLSCLDLLPAFRAHPQKEALYFNYNADPHFDILGHALTAEMIDQHLTLP